MNLKRLQKTIEDLNQFGSTGKGVTRLAYTKEHREVTEYFMELCRREGMSVKMDACGNVVARREGLEAGLPAVACGSHLDTVINGGRYDGLVGMAAALEVVRSFNEQRIDTLYPIEIISFSCEESSRFGVATIGSKAMAGVLNPPTIGKLTDRNGVTLEDALADWGLNISSLKESVRGKDELRLFLEMHIEQGPILESECKSVGVVRAIAAPTRLQVKVQGMAAHSGSTPMHQRKDALLGAMEIALEVEKAAQSESCHGTVATVGVLEILPGAMNVIPDSALMKIDIRSGQSASKRNVLERLVACFERVENERGLSIEWTKLCDEEPVKLDKVVVQSLKESCEKLGIPYMNMNSGAGHDAMNMVGLCPTGLIFIPSKNGLSHHPDEFTAMDEIFVGAQLLEEEILKWSVGKIVREEGVS